MLPRCQVLQLFHQRQVRRQILALKPREVLAKIPRPEFMRGRKTSAKQPPRQRPIRHQADSKLAQRWQHLILRIARPERVFDL